MGNLTKVGLLRTSQAQAVFPAPRNPVKIVTGTCQSQSWASLQKDERNLQRNTVSPSVQARLWVLVGWSKDFRLKTKAEAAFSRPAEEWEAMGASGRFRRGSASSAGHFRMLGFNNSGSFSAASSVSAGATSLQSWNFEQPIAV